MTNLERRLPATDPGAMEVRSPLDHTANDQRPASGVTPGEQLVKIYAGKLFDPDTLQFLPQRMVTVARNAGLVLDVQPWTAEQLRGVDFEDANTVDLRDATVLPGFFDAHVHCEIMRANTRPTSLLASSDARPQSSCTRTRKRRGRTS